MRNKPERLWSHLYLATTSKGYEWILKLAASAPEAYALKYFGGSPEPVERPEFSVKNAVAFEKALSEGNRPLLYGDGYYVDAMQYEETTAEVRVFAKSVTVATDLLRTWFPVLASEGMIYGWAGLSSEEDERNGYWLGRVGTDQRKAHGWVGRDYRRYVPGLYWLNYFSCQYAKVHGVDLESLALRTTGRLQRFEHGGLLELYESPEEWRDKNDLVAEVLKSTPGFFSKGHAAIPQMVAAPLQFENVMDELHKKWP